MRWFLVLAVLAGCSTPEERAAGRLRFDTEKCTGYGFTPGTDGFAQCRMRMEQARWDAVIGSFPRAVNCTTVGTVTSCW